MTHYPTKEKNLPKQNKKDTKKQEVKLKGAKHDGIIM